MSVHRTEDGRPPAAGPLPQRRQELARRLQAVQDRVATACAAAGRSRADVTLIVVTKTWPASDVRLLAELGVRDVAESRDQEARDKVAACADLDLRWHFVGQLQRNKARSVAGYAAVVHTVDRAPLVAALQAGRAAQPGPLPPLPVLLQVSLDVDRDAAGPSDVASGRGGAAPLDVARLADLVAAADALMLTGVMAVAPQRSDPAEAFARLVAIGARLARQHPGATVVSAGMSGDLEAAVAAGATHLRVGSAVLGARPLLR